MSTEVQQFSKQAEQPPDKGLSAAKIALIGTIATAAISAVATIGVALVGDDNSPPPPDKGGTVIQSSPMGSVGTVTPSKSGSEVTVTGWAASDVDNVVVLIGPRSSEEPYWVGKAPVSGERWETVVKTGPHIEPGYTVAAYFNRGISINPIPGVQGVLGKPMNFTTPVTPPPPQPAIPADITQCAAQYGDRCFTGPNWGPPAIYKPNA